MKNYRSLSVTWQLVFSFPCGFRLNAVGANLAQNLARIVADGTAHVK